MSTCRLSVIVPVFNGASFIAATVRKLNAYLDGLAAELIVVDDGSTERPIRVSEGRAALEDALAWMG